MKLSRESRDKTCTKKASHLSLNLCEIHLLIRQFGQLQLLRGYPLAMHEGLNSADSMLATSQAMTPRPVMRREA